MCFGRNEFLKLKVIFNKFLQVLHFEALIASARRKADKTPCMLRNIEQSLCPMTFFLINFGRPYRRDERWCGCLMAVPLCPLIAGAGKKLYGLPNEWVLFWCAMITLKEEFYSAGKFDPSPGTTYSSSSSSSSRSSAQIIQPLGLSKDCKSRSNGKSFPNRLRDWYFLFLICSLRGCNIK